MARKIYSSKILRLILALFLAAGVYKTYTLFAKGNTALDYTAEAKTISVSDGGFQFSVSTHAQTVGDFLKTQNITVADHDRLWPDPNTKIYPGAHIEIQRAVPIKIEADGKEISNWSLAKNVAGALAENKITLSHLDKTAPALSAPLEKNLEIVVTRINVEEVTQQEDVAFKTIVQTDSSLGWREKKVEKPGVKGTKEVKYRITYKNGRKISQVVLSSKVTQAPVSQVEIHGTQIKVGKAERGQGTWYTQPAYLKQAFSPIVSDFAASTTIAKGDYAKVTNTDNGKSIIVQIDDYGPQGKGRIIDLDKNSFAKIAPIGAGVINVKVEPILN